MNSFRKKFKGIMDFYSENIMNYRDVFNNISNGKIVPFVGAGMSVPIYKTVSEVLSIMAEKSETRLPLEQEHFEDKVAFLLTKMSKPAYYKMLQKLYDVEEITRKPDILSHMAVNNLPHIIQDGVIITSNYDRVIEAVYKNHNNDSCEVAYLTDREVITRWFREAQNKTLLIKIHGDISQPEDTIIFDKDSYDRMYAGDGESQTTLIKCMEQKVLLFMGCSLQHDRFLDALRTINKPGIQNYAIYPCSKGEVGKTYKRLSDDRIFPILFPDCNYECVDILLKALAQDEYTQFEVVDNSNIDKMLITNSEGNELKELIRNYYAAHGNYDIVMKAVFNEICIKVDHVITKLYELAMNDEGPVFLLADSGSGKTTDLCQLAKYAYEKSVKVLFSDGSEIIDGKLFILELKGAIKKNKDVLICVDNIEHNQELLNYIYKYCLEDKSNRVHFVFATKVNEFYRLVNSEMTSYRNWKKSPQAVYLWKDYENIKELDKGTTPCFKYCNIHVYESVSEDKQNIINQAKLYLDNNFGQNLENARIADTVDSNTSIAKAVRTHLNILSHKDSNDLALSPDECEWMEATRVLDELCSKRPISSCFKYIAALQLYKINLSISDLITITGFDNQFGFSVVTNSSMIQYENLCRILKSVSYINEEILSQKNEIEFLNDIIAIEYFAERRDKGCLLFCVLRDLIDNSTLNNEQAVLFEKKVFSAKIISSASCIKDMYTYKIEELLEIFCKNKGYYKAVLDSGRLYSIATAKVLLNSAKGNKNNEDIISVAFDKTHIEDKKQKNIIWIKLLNLAVGNSDNIPNSLLEYVSEDNYKQLTDLLSNYYKNFRLIKSEDEWMSLLEYMKMFYSRVLEIDPMDIPAILGLGEIYERKKQYTKQLFLYLNTINSEELKGEQLNILTKYLSVYEQCNADNSDGVESEYNRWLNSLTSKCKTEDNNEFKRYHSIVSSMYVLYLKRISEFEKAFSVAEDMSDDYPESYRKNMVLGYLYQDARETNKRNNMFKAIECFEFAYEELLREFETPDKRSQLRILRPLMNTYISVRNTSDARMVGELILNIDPKDSEVKDIINHNKYNNSNLFEYQGNYMLYRIIDDFTASIVSFEDSGKTMVSLPDVIDNHTIVKIGHDCFGENNHVIEISLPPNIMEIQNNAFSGCRKLERINIPASCISIGRYAFQWCKSLRKIELPHQLEEIEEATFISCYNLSEITIPEGLKRIGRRAFMNCEHINLQIPDSVEVIEKEAFVGLSVNQIKTNNCIDIKAEHLYQWPFNELICHQHWGQGIVRSVSFKSKDVYEISVEFLDGVTRVFLFPNINDNLFRFMNDNSQHQLNTMIKRRKKKNSKSQRTA